MIYLSQYVGKWSTSEDWNTERQDNANKLLDAANKLMDCMSAYGIDFLINPTTMKLPRLLTACAMEEL